MAKRAASKAVKERLHEDAEAPIGRLTIRPSKITQFRLWIVGTTPLITHAWAEKAKREMLGTQLKVIKGGRAARDPERDFMDSLYEMTPDLYGFPVTGLKKAIISQAHKDRGVPKTTVQASLWLHHEMIRVRPALAGAICDMPLIRIYGAKPEMREDMVRVGAGLNKRATLAYRAQFWPWAFYLSGRFNADVLTLDTIGTLIHESGFANGIGEWRNEKSGIFGAFRLASETEANAWDRFRSGDGEMPAPPEDMAEAAD